VSEIIRTRDVIVFVKGLTFTVPVTPRAATLGWQGGLFFQWTQPVGDEMLADLSDGLYGGMALYGSDETSDKYTSMTGNQSAYKYVTLMAGGWLIATTAFEKYTYASRMGGGPLVPIDYHASDRLVISLNSRLTSEDEWSLSGDPRAPNSYFIAFLSQIPTSGRNGYMTVQLSI
jgi:hypothetical protein